MSTRSISFEPPCRSDSNDAGGRLVLGEIGQRRLGEGRGDAKRDPHRRARVSSDGEADVEPGAGAALLREAHQSLRGGRLRLGNRHDILVRNARVAQRRTDLRRVSGPGEAPRKSRGRTPSERDALPSGKLGDPRGQRRFGVATERRGHPEVRRNLRELGPAQLREKLSRGRVGGSGVAHDSESDVGVALKPSVAAEKRERRR